MLCFRKILVAKKFMGKREREVSRFSFREILSHSVEKCRKGILYSFINFGYRTILCFRGLCDDFPSKIFCLVVQNDFVGQTFRFSLISGIEQFYASDGYVTIFCRSFFLSQCPKFSLGNPLLFHHFRVSKNVRDKP